MQNRTLDHFLTVSSPDFVGGRRRFTVGAAVLGLVLWTCGHPPSVIGAPAPSPVTQMEEGKALYETGRYQDAISKFIMVLRSDPQNPEARQYLRQSVDQLRQNPASGAGANRIGRGPSPEAQADMRRMLQKRAAFTLVLNSVPGVKISGQNAVNQVEINTALLFPPKAGGLKEEGIPMLDRVAAWLKTFGQQPVVIHCYPEELEDPSTNGGLFLRRYSELYTFFVEERKLSPQRFISTDMLVEDVPGKAAPAKPVGGEPRIVIETMGSQASLLDGGMPTSLPKTAIARWLEFAVIAHRQVFNPDEGEWATLDIAALGRTPLRQWEFRIVTDKNAAVVVSSGTGNILRRFNWDGRNPVTGSFVQAGGYQATLKATDSDGAIKTDQVALQVMRSAAPEPEEAPVVKKTPAKKTAKKSTKKAAAETSASEPASGGSEALSSPQPPEPDPTPTAPPVQETPATGGETESDQAIWKQVVQFDAGSSELAPSLMSSLERIGKTLEVYPLQKVRLVGFASTSETNALALAKKRADAVRQVLIGQLGVDPKRVETGSASVKQGEGMSKVELSITN